MHGNVLPTVNGTGTFACPLLDPNMDYAGFNGNKLLKGRGYLITSPGGWMAKAGHSADEVPAFFADLAVLAGRFDLIAVGVQPHNPDCLDLGQLSALARSVQPSNPLRHVHLRLYAPADYLARWNRAFGWQDG